MQETAAKLGPFIYDSDFKDGVEVNMMDIEGMIKLMGKED